VVSIASNKLVMTNMEGKETHTCTVNADANITCDGKTGFGSEVRHEDPRDVGERERTRGNTNRSPR
jgi:hypothetical protein